MITIKQISITDLSTDAIVNAANEQLQAGGGVSRTLHRRHSSGAQILSTVL